MADFTIIEGGMAGKDPAVFRAERRAQRLLTELIIASLRGLARGREDGSFSRAFDRLIEHLAKADVNMWRVADGAFDEAKNGKEFEGLYDALDDDGQVVLNALRLAAETLANDDAATARASKRRQELSSSMKDWVLEGERRARANGWSLLETLAEEADRRYPTRARSAPSQGVPAAVSQAVGKQMLRSTRQAQVTFLDPASAKRKSIPATTDQIAYIRSLGVPLATLRGLVGPIDQAMGSVWHSQIAASLKGQTKQRISITDVSHRLIPALKCVTEEDLVR